MYQPIRLTFYVIKNSDDEYLSHFEIVNDEDGCYCRWSSSAEIEDAIQFESLESAFDIVESLNKQYRADHYTSAWYEEWGSQRCRLKVKEI